MTQGLPPSKEAVLHSKSKSVPESQHAPTPPHRNYGFPSLRTISDARKSVSTSSARFWVLYVPLLTLFLSFSYFLTNHVSKWADGTEDSQVRMVASDNGGLEDREEQGGVSGSPQDLAELGKPLNGEPYDLARLEGVDVKWLEEEDTAGEAGKTNIEVKAKKMEAGRAMNEDGGSRSWPVRNAHNTNDSGATAGETVFGDAENNAEGGSRRQVDLAESQMDANSTNSSVVNRVAGELPESADSNRSSQLEEEGEMASKLPFPFVLESSSAKRKESSEFFECDRSGERSDVCILRGEVLVFSRHNLVVLLTQDPAFPTRVETIRPYTKKWDPGVSANIWEFTVRTLNGSGQNLVVGGEGGGVGMGVEASGAALVTNGQKRKRKLLQDAQVVGPEIEGYEKNIVKDGNRTNVREEMTGDSLRANVEVGGNIKVEGNRSREQGKNRPWSGVQIVEGGGWDLVDEKDAPPLKDWEGKDLNPEARWEVVPNPTDENARVALEEDVPRPLRCDVRHNVTGVIFSTGGYTGNVYHEFADGLVPLFITSQEYSGEVVILIAEWHRNWIGKFGSVLRQLSNYPPVMLGLADEVHCFPQMVAGQVAHDEFMVQQEEMRNKVGIAEFQKVIGRAFHPWPPTTLPLQPPSPGQPPPTDCHPLLTILVRDGSRRMTNVDQVVGWAQEGGYAVRLVEPTHGMRLEELWAVMQEADVMLGVHGAALTHWIFLRPTTVFIQLVPFGMIWTAKLYYGEPSMQLPLQYMEVLVEPHESSLIEKYPANHTVFTNQQVYWDQGWNVVADLYFHNQDITWSKDNAMRVLSQAKEKWEKVESTVEKSERNKRCQVAPKH